MARLNKINLRAFQQELSERLKHKTAAQVDSLRLAIEGGGRSWLVRLGDAGEVVPCPTAVTVALAQPWFLGLANIRGGLYGMIDFGMFLSGEPTPRGMGSRLVLLGQRFPDLRAGLVVNRVLGLRNLGDFEQAAADTGQAWSTRVWRDKTDAEWRE